MKLICDATVDTLNIIVKDNVAIAESDEDKPGIILDCDKDENPVLLEILDAFRLGGETRRIEFEIVK